MKKTDFDNKIKELFTEYHKYVNKKNEPLKAGNGIFNRFKYPILTRNHAPVFWKYDLDYKSNPNLIQRLGVNSTFNAGAIELNGKYYLIVRVEGFDVKSFFGVAESSDGINNFKLG